MSRNALRITITTSFEIPAPTEDQLTDIAMDAGIEGDEPTEAELDEAYESWKEQISEEYKEGGEVPSGARSDIELEEVSL